jgi:thousand and one amino acid protein kinase
MTLYIDLTQISKQHESELKNQKDYMERAEKDLLRKHAAELKLQPKSLKVRILRKIIIDLLYI